MKTLLNLFVSILLLTAMDPLVANGQSAFNLINDGSFEDGFVPNDQQGNLPDTWFHVNTIIPGADVYSSDPATKNGMLPGTWFNWDLGMNAAEGLRFVAGCDFQSAGCVEGFGNELLASTITGHAYSVSGQFRFSNLHNRRGVYDIYLTVGELTVAELTDPDKAVFVGSLGRNSNWDEWTYDSMHFVAPGAYSHLIMLPRSLEVSSSYPGCDDWNLEDLGPASLQTDVRELQIVPGGTVNFSLDAGPAHANRSYFLLGSITGIEPGLLLPGGTATLHLNWDFFTNFVVLNANAPFFADFLGTLDPAGTGTAQFNTFGSLPPELTGIQLSFAYLLYEPFDFASNAVALEIKP